MTTSTTTTLEHAIGEAGRFILQLPSGDVRIRAVAGTIARVRSLDGRPLDELFRVDLGDGELGLRGPDRLGLDLGSVIGLRDRRASLEIEVPAGTEVSAETASGDLRVEGTKGGGRYRSASGDLALTGVAGRLTLETVSGDIELAAGGDVGLRIRTVSGDVAVRAARIHSLQVSTTSGDVRLDGPLVGPGPYAISSISGDATVVGRTGLRVEARTVTGDLSAELPHRVMTAPGRRTMVVGEGESLLEFKSVSGDLRIVNPRDDASTGGPASEPISDWPSEPDEAAAETDLEPDSRRAERLRVLRAVEAGEVSIDEAGTLLAEIEAADA